MDCNDDNILNILIDCNGVSFSNLDDNLDSDFKLDNDFETINHLSVVYILLGIIFC
jgi:hypothetical protein